MHVTGMLRGLLLAAGIVVLAAPSLADIKSFNAAMKVKDYKAAAAAAASTWPGLDKSRKDLAVIAREFGFAAYLSGDFAAAKTYGEAASAASRVAAEEPVLVIASDLLWRLAEYRIRPNGDTRGRLFTLLQARAAHPSVDLITYLSADTVTAYDFEKGVWRDAVASAALGDRLTVNRLGYVDASFRFQLLGVAATYMLQSEAPAYRSMGQLQQRITTAIGAAPEGADITQLKEVYYDTMAWSSTLRAHLIARNRLKDDEQITQEWAKYTKSPEYLAAAPRINPPLPEGVCIVSPNEKTDLPDYPSSAVYRGMIGAIILKLDIDEAGRAYNPRVLAAAPLKHFGDAALKGAHKIRYAAREGSAPVCTLAQKDKTLMIQFSMPG